MHGFPRSVFQSFHRPGVCTFLRLGQGSIAVELDHLISEFLTEVKCPVTIFHGQDDRMIPIHHAELLKDNFPKIKLVSFKGYGHTNFLKEEIFKIALSNSLDEL